MGARINLMYAQILTLLFYFDLEQQLLISHVWIEIFVVDFYTSFITENCSWHKVSTQKVTVEWIIVYFNAHKIRFFCEI